MDKNKIMTDEFINEFVAVAKENDYVKSIMVGGQKRNVKGEWYLDQDADDYGIIYLTIKTKQEFLFDVTLEINGKFRVFKYKMMGVEREGYVLYQSPDEIIKEIRIELAYRADEARSAIETLVEEEYHGFFHVCNDSIMGTLGEEVSMDVYVKIDYNVTTMDDIIEALDKLDEIDSKLMNLKDMGVDISVM